MSYDVATIVRLASAIDESVLSAIVSGMSPEDQATVAQAMADAAMERAESERRAAAAKRAESQRKRLASLFGSDAEGVAALDLLQGTGEYVLANWHGPLKVSSDGRSFRTIVMPFDGGTVKVTVSTDAPTGMVIAAE